MRHLMNPLDFSVEELDRLFDLANDIEANTESFFSGVWSARTVTSGDRRSRAAQRRAASILLPCSFVLSIFD